MSARASAPVMRPARKDYGYCNARVRGMWSHLIGQDKLDQLVSAPDVEAQIRILSATKYKPELEDALLQGHTASSIDRALRKNLARTSAQVLDMLPPDGLILVQSLLARWDIFDVKTVIRGVHAHSSPDEIIDSFMPAATLTDTELAELAQVEDVQAVVDTLATWRLPYAKPLDAAMAEYREFGDTAPLELAVDCWFFSQVKERLRKGRGRDRKIVRRIFGTTVDVENLTTVFRIAGSDLEPDKTVKYWLPGGTAIDLAIFQRMAQAENVDRAIDALRRTPYAKPLEEAAMDFAMSGRISVLERTLENLLTREIIACRRPDPLSIGIVVAFMWAKQNEVTNVRIAVTGRAVGLPEDRMRRELIVV